MLKLMTLTIGLLFTSLSFASLLNLTAGEQKIADINVAKSAEVNHGSDKAMLNSVGAGLRNKKVVFVNVKVYVGQFFVADTAGFNKSNPLESLKNQTAAAMQMTFLRDVDAEKIHTSFEESLDTNGIDKKDPAIVQLLAAIQAGGEVKNGKTITAAYIKKDKSDLILIETPDGKITELNGAGLAQKVFALWLGKGADSGVEEMKKALLK